MNALLACFVPELRDLLQIATAGLLRLERDTGDDALINEVFRAVHTIKGSSGLFEAAPLTRLVHGAEDLLGEVRAGRLALTADMVDRLLGALDQVGIWVDALEQHECLPDDAAAAAGESVAGLRALMPAYGDATPAALAAAKDGAPDWLALLDADEAAAVAHRLATGAAVLSIHYVPDAGCFYRGEDPLYLVRQLPDLLMLRISARTPWAAVAELDPYCCNLEFYALAGMTHDAAAHLFRYVIEQVELVQLPPPAAPAAGAAEDRPSALLARLLAEQRRILALPAETTEELHRRIDTVAATVGRLVHDPGVPARHGDLQDAVAGAHEAGHPAALLTLLDGILGRLEHTATPGAPSPGATAEPAARTAGRVLKVDQDSIDRLMNLIGELVVSKNALPFLARRAELVHGSREMSREIKDQYAVIDRLAQEMRGAIMQVRMIPVSEVFERFPRLVRDLARKLDKRIELVITGADTAADKTIIEALGDPLLHIVRNAIDHGIEAAGLREAAGKPGCATLRLAAGREADQVVIEVSDDGRGIDPERVRRSAIDKGLLEAGQAALLSDQEAVNLIFRAGFSTAAEISDLSGRGVGMDVVRTTVERLGGTAGVASVPGQGTRVRLSLPLSMAITRVMTVEAGGTLFGIPMDLIGETVRLDPARVRTIKRAETFVLRDEVVPLRKLSDSARPAGRAARPAGASRRPRGARGRCGDGAGGGPVSRGDGCRAQADGRRARGPALLCRHGPAGRRQRAARARSEGIAVMPLRADGAVLCLEAECGVEEALELLAQLTAPEPPVVDLRSCTHLHTALVQVLAACRPGAVIPPDDPFLARWLMPLLPAPSA